jgi:hypothetical protein
MKTRVLFLAGAEIFLFATTLRPILLFNQRVLI